MGIAFTKIEQGDQAALEQWITIKTDATLNGRALAGVGAVTLDTNAVTAPAVSGNGNGGGGHHHHGD